VIPASGKIYPIPDQLAGKSRDARKHQPSLAWNYAIKGLLRRGETSVLYGPSNCGKSALVCYLGSRIVSGQTCFGGRVKKGIVVHVGAEAPESILDRLQACELHRDAAPYLVGMAPVDLSQTDEVVTFIQNLMQLQEANGEEIILVVFDTLARSIGATDENCASAMTSVVHAAERIARQTMSHVMLVHHTGKDADRGSRGSSALRSAVDTEIALSPLKSGTVAVSTEKQRTMPKSTLVHFKTEIHVLGQDEDGENRTTVKAVEIVAPPKLDEEKHTGGDAGCDQAVLSALHFRRMTGTQAAKPFRPRDIFEALPPELFGEIAEESRIRKISRCLEGLSKRRPAIVEKDAGGDWRLVPDGVGTSAMKT
jgi:hypothetical protein